MHVTALYDIMDIRDTTIVFGLKSKVSISGHENKAEKQNTVSFWDAGMWGTNSQIILGCKLN